MTDEPRTSQNTTDSARFISSSAQPYTLLQQRTLTYNVHSRLAGQTIRRFTPAMQIFSYSLTVKTINF